MRQEYTRSEPGERIDHPDFEHSTEVGLRKALTKAVEELIVGEFPGSGRAFILDGFSVGTAAATTSDYGELTGAALSGGQVRVNRGSALLGLRDRGEISFGHLLTEGDTTKTIDISGYPDGTYGVFVRFELRDDKFQNRLFWDPYPGTPIEFARSIPTRRVESWSMSIELTSPGEEWLKLIDVTKSGGSITGITDRRTFFFDGAVDASYAVTEWGTADDRDPTAPLIGAGVKTFRRFVRAVQKQLEGIIGKDSFGADAIWKSDPEAGALGTETPRSLADLNNRKLDRFGSNAIAGSILVDPDVTHKIGQLTGRLLELWSQTVFARTVKLGADYLTTAALANVARIDLAFKQGSSNLRTKFLDSYGNTTPADGTRVLGFRATTAHFGSSGTIELAANALWDDATQQWSREAAGDSWKIQFHGLGLNIFRRAAGDSSPWVESAWTNVATFDIGELNLDVDLDVSGSAAIGNGAVVSAGNIVATTGNITSDSTSSLIASAGNLQGQRLKLTTDLADGAAAGADFLYANMFFKAIGLVQHNGSGGFDAGNSTVHNINLSTSSIDSPNDTITLKFFTPMTATRYFPLILPAYTLAGLGTAVFPTLINIASDSFTFQFIDHMGASFEPDDPDLRYVVAVAGAN